MSGLSANPAFITGLTAESRALTRGTRAHDSNLSPKIACAGARPAQARREAERLVTEGATLLVSLGVAGGLDPALAPGTLLIPEAIDVGDGQVHATDAGFHRGLVAATAEISPVTTKMVGSDQVVASVADKAALFTRSGASAVDMESHMVAKVAAHAAIPFLVIRTVIDSADAALPSSVIGSTAPDGRSRGGLVAARLCLTPWQLPAIRRLQSQMRTALGSLERAATLAAPVLFGRF